MASHPPGSATCVSLGIIAWNEEAAIRPMLDSLFAQSLFAELARRGLRAEIVCVTNGCTDRTPAIVDEVFAAQRRGHPCAAAFRCRLADIPERGKLNAWNLFVHELSAHEAACLFLMDGDIVLHHPDTLWNMYQALTADPEASVVTDQPLKDIAFKPAKSLAERLSLSASRLTGAGSAQLTGQLYGIKTGVARNIYLPRDLVACEDGFIKNLVCTSFLTREASPRPIVRAPDASHVFEAYTSPRDILNNQKRQMIGQTIVHLLVDRHLRQLPREARLELAATLRAWEAADPDWLKRLIGDHVRQTRHFWRLFPEILTFRFRRLAQCPAARRLFQFPAAVAGLAVMLVACWRAHRFLRQGYTHYWPDTQSPKLRRLDPGGTTRPAVSGRLVKAAVPTSGAPP